MDKEILRAAMIAELDEINLYEQMAGMTQDKDVKKLLVDVAREEKTHVGVPYFSAKDPQQKNELDEGKKEVEALLRGREI